MWTLVIMAIGTIVLCGVAYKCLDSMNGAAFFVGFLSSIAALCGGAFLALCSWGWIASEHEARLINQQLGTSYTREDLFFASGYIDEVREMHRKRIELNGDLMQDKD